MKDLALFSPIKIKKDEAIFKLSSAIVIAIVIIGVSTVCMLRNFSCLS